MEGLPRVRVSGWPAKISADIAAARARSATLISPDAQPGDESAPMLVESVSQSWLMDRRMLRLLLLVVLVVGAVGAALMYVELDRRDSERSSARAACQALFDSLNLGSFDNARVGLDQVLHELRPESLSLLAEAIHAEVDSLVSSAKALEATDPFLAGRTYRRAAYACLLVAAIVPSEAERAGDGFVAAADLFLVARKYEMATTVYAEAVQAYEAALDALVVSGDTRTSRIRTKHKAAMHDAVLARAYDGKGEP